MAKKQTKKTSRVAKVVNLNPYVKDSWAEYSAHGLTPKYTINRFDDKKGNRFYYFKKDGDVVIAAGSTTVFGIVSTERERLEDWKDDHPNWRHLSDVSSEYGNRSHIQKGNIMFKKGVDLKMMEEMTKMIVDNGGSPNTPAKDMLSFMRFQEDYQLTPLLIEASLVYQDPITGEWLAMTIDLLAKMVMTIKTKTKVEDGVYQRGANKGEIRYREVTEESKVEKILLIDFKSNFFEKEKKSYFETHKLQLMAAKLAVEQNFDIKVDDLYNFSENNWRTEPGYTFYKWNLDDKDWRIFNAYWELAQAKDINKPKGNMLITEGFKNSTDYKFLSYKEYVEQVLIKSN